MAAGDVFETPRLLVRDWHAPESAGTVTDLPAEVASMLTEPVTRWLPPEWGGHYSRARAADWIADRDREGPVLLVVDREHGHSLGLMLLFEQASERAADEEASERAADIDLRLGYLLAETAWGRGLGSELLYGFISWCRSRPEVRSVVGGVAPENVASIRLLQRAGFRPIPDGGTGDELTYRLELRDRADAAD